jgi:hypothetical protein
MKKLLLILNALFILVLVNAQSITTPQPSPTQTLKQNFGVGSIELNYSRPAKKAGR